MVPVNFAFRPTILAVLGPLHLPGVQCIGKKLASANLLVVAFSALFVVAPFAESPSFWINPETASTRNRKAILLPTIKPEVS